MQSEPAVYYRWNLPIPIIMIHLSGIKCGHLHLDTSSGLVLHRTTHDMIPYLDMVVPGQRELLVPAMDARVLSISVHRILWIATLCILE